MLQLADLTVATDSRHASRQFAFDTRSTTHERSCRYSALCFDTCKHTVAATTVLASSRKTAVSTDIVKLPPAAMISQDAAAACRGSFASMLALSSLTAVVIDMVKLRQAGLHDRRGIATSCCTRHVSIIQQDSRRTAIVKPQQGSPL